MIRLNRVLIRQTGLTLTLLILMTAPIAQARTISAKPARFEAESPEKFVAERARKLVTELRQRPIPPPPRLGAIGIQAQAQKSSWLDSLYERKLVDASWATEMLSDKRLLFEVLKSELGEEATRFYPRTIGLREFLFQKKFLSASGEITASGEEIEEALHELFKSGFVVRPAVGVAPRETGRGLYPDSDEFVSALIDSKSVLYDSSHTKPVRSHILEKVASGEAVVIQEDVVGSADLKRRLKSRFFKEVRVHTYESKVVEGAVPKRWVQANLLTGEQVARAEEFVADFLKRLTPSLTYRQAWGIDVAVMDNGEMRVIDVVTNRGKKGPWSSYLDQPHVIGAYTRKIETAAGVYFEGLNGTLIRNGFANYMPYWKKRIEKAPAGVSKLMAYLPPLP